MSLEIYNLANLDLKNFSTQLTLLTGKSWYLQAIFIGSDSILETFLGSGIDTPGKFFKIYWIGVSELHKNTECLWTTPSATKYFKIKLE